MSAAILFDLGNTLAAYYRREEFRPILERAVAKVWKELQSHGIKTVSYEKALQAAIAENREASDFRVTPMTVRFERIFRIVLGETPLSMTLCGRFLEPIFAVSRVYADTLQSLDQVREAGYKTGIVSNAPWGSPAVLWRKELERLGLATKVDCVVMCSDVGWRKPAPQIFMHAAERLNIDCSKCTFVGDEPEWDIVGSAAVGMRPVLIDRGGHHPEFAGERVHDLEELLKLL